MLLLLAACDDSQPDPADLKNTDELLAAEDSARSSNYICDGGISLEARYEPRHDQMVLFLVDRAVRLEHVESASGAKFSADGIVFRTKGETAKLIRHGEPERDCEQTPATGH